MAEFKPIPGFDNNYLISKRGSVFSFKNCKYLKTCGEVDGKVAVYLQPKGDWFSRRAYPVEELIELAWGEPNG